MYSPKKGNNETLNPYWPKSRRLSNVMNWLGGNIFHKFASKVVIHWYYQSHYFEATLISYLFLNYRWSAESVFAKNLLSIVHLLLAIVTFYQTRKNIYLDLPKSLNIEVLIVRSLNGSTAYKKETETLFGYGMISVIFFGVLFSKYLLMISLCTP